MIYTVSFFLCLAIFGAGIIYRFVGFFRVSIGPQDESFLFLDRFYGVMKGFFLTLVSPVKMFLLCKSIVMDVVLQISLLRRHPLKWVMHILIFWGFTGLVLFHALEGFISEPFFSDYASTLNPFMALRNGLGAMVILGLAMALFFRKKNPRLRMLSKSNDYVAIFLLAAIMISGFCLEASKIISPARFDEMVEDWGDIEEEEELPALKTFWQEEFNVVFPGKTLEVSPGIMEEGEVLHDNNCAECHSKPAWAFVSYPVSLAMRPLAGVFNGWRMDQWLWYIHFLSCFLGLAYLPFSKFLHILTSPASLMIRAVAGQKVKTPENRATRRAFDIHACTQCGTCSLHCSVGPVFQLTQNPLVLPSERLMLVRKTVQDKSLDPEAQADFIQGTFVCTECNRCSQVCPAGMDLQDIWGATKKQLSVQPHMEPVSRVKTRCLDNQYIPAKGEVISIKPSKENLLDQLKTSFQASTFSNCYACMTCTNACPIVADLKEGDVFGTAPHQVIHSLSLGLMEKALATPMIWNCLTCYKCQEDCPQGVRITDIFYELRNMAFDREFGL